MSRTPEYSSDKSLGTFTSKEELDQMCRMYPEHFREAYEFWHEQYDGLLDEDERHEKALDMAWLACMGKREREVKEKRQELKQKYYEQIN